MGARKPWGRFAWYGAGSFACYAALFAWQDEVMATFTRTDGAYWLLPVLTPFVFSYFHGGFTSCFWDVLGVQARQPVPRAVEKQEVEE
jgi:hypothetical protein